MHLLTKVMPSKTKKHKHTWLVTRSMTYPQAKAKFPNVLSFVFLLLTIEIILFANIRQAIGRGQSCPSKALISSPALALQQMFRGRFQIK
jgi:hypothetical protein